MLDAETIILSIADVLRRNPRGNLVINEDKKSITIHRNEALFSKIGPTTEAGSVGLKVEGPPYVCILKVDCTIDEIFEKEDLEAMIDEISKNEKYCNQHIVKEGFPVSAVLRYMLEADCEEVFESDKLNEMLNECLDAAARIENAYWIE